MAICVEPGVLPGFFCARMVAFTQEQARELLNN